MSWELVTIGGVPLRESQTADLGEEALGVSGREMNTITTSAEVLAAHGDIPQLADQTVPVVFEGKPHLSGFYRVAGASSSLRRMAGGRLVIANWEVTLERVGSERDVEVESRVPSIARLDELAGTQTPSFWHAPAVGASSYWTGATVPSASTTRVSADGPVPVYTGIPASTAPRWTVAAADYLKGSVRVLLDGIRRVGSFTPPHSSWQVDNGLVRVAGDVDGSVTVAAWVDNNWRSVKGYQFTVTGAPLTTIPEFSILRNDPEEVAVRLSYPTTPGRVTVDLSLRRGSRFVAGTVKRHSTTALGVVRTAAETAAAVTGGLRASAADADGNRFVMGTTRTATTATGTAAISKASVTAFDFFLGHEFGASPATHDTFASLLAQFIAAGGVRTRIVRR